MELKHQHCLVNNGKKWSEMTTTEKVAEREWTLAQDVKLGYITEQQFNVELQRSIHNILNDKR